MNLVQMAQRYCDSCSSCSECKEGTNYEECLVYFLAGMNSDPEKVIARVMAWNKEHGDETSYAQFFFRHFPKAERAVIEGRVVPKICIKEFFPSIKCTDNCVFCWNQPYHAAVKA